MHIERSRGRFHSLVIISRKIEFCGIVKPAPTMSVSLPSTHTDWLRKQASKRARSELASKRISGRAIGSQYVRRRRTDRRRSSSCLLSKHERTSRLRRVRSVVAWRFSIAVATVARSKAQQRRKRRKTAHDDRVYDSSFQETFWNPVGTDAQIFCPPSRSGQRE